MKEFFSPHRIFEIFGFLILSVAFIISLILPADPLTWIPAARITIPIVNGLCALACIPLIIKPGIKSLEISIFLIQSFFTTWTGYETLGMFLYSAMIVFLFCYGFFMKHIHRRVFFIMFIWLIWLLGVIPYGFARCALVYTTFLFMFAFYYAVYSKLKHLLSPLLPSQSKEAIVKLPPQGSLLNLSDCQLSERQIKILNKYLETNASYSELADKFIVSVSTVKKEMASILHIFGVKNCEELRYLLSHYRLN